MARERGANSCPRATLPSTDPLRLVRRRPSTPRRAAAPPGRVGSVDDTAARRGLVARLDGARAEDGGGARGGGRNERSVARRGLRAGDALGDDGGWVGAI